MSSALLALGRNALSGFAVPATGLPERIRSVWLTDPAERVFAEHWTGKDRVFTLAALRADRDWPLDWDARLVVGPGVPKDRADYYRTRAAFLLAPRRVVNVRAPTAPALFRIEPLPEAAP